MEVSFRKPGDSEGSRGSNNTMPARAEVSSPDADAVLAILSRPDDVDLAELVELVARICDSQAAGITVQRGE